MVWRNLFVACQVCDGAREFQDPVVSPGSQLQLAHGGSHEGVTSFIQMTIKSNILGVHIRKGGRASHNPNALEIARVWLQPLKSAIYKNNQLTERNTQEI